MHLKKYIWHMVGIRHQTPILFILQITLYFHNSKIFTIFMQTKTSLRIEKTDNFSNNKPII